MPNAVGMTFAASEYTIYFASAMSRLIAIVCETSHETLAEEVAANAATVANWLAIGVAVFDEIFDIKFKRRNICRESDEGDDGSDLLEHDCNPG